MIPTLARAAVAAGCDALFLEVHPDPDHALSDGPNSLRINDLQGLLRTCLRIREAISPDGAPQPGVSRRPRARRGDDIETDGAADLVVKPQNADAGRGAPPNPWVCPSVHKKTVGRPPKGLAARIDASQ